MVILKSAYKFRAYPSKAQKETLNKHMYLSKELYNILLEKSKTYYKDTKKTLTEYRMNIWITEMKKERPEFAELHSQVLQNVSKRVSDAYRHFFRRCKEKKSGKNVKVGFPRYKNFVSSLTYPQTNGFKIEKKKAELSKIGRINFVNHRDMEGTIKTLTIKKTKSQEWYITIAVEQEDKPFMPNNSDKVGMDLGINKYAVLSDGSILQNKRVQAKDRIKLKRLQRTISRRKKVSHKRRKAVLNFTRKYEHITRVKNDHLHKLSHTLVHSYSFIAYEELRIANMVQNRHLARSIGESSWGNFTQMLQYKAESAGCVAVGVNPQNTSRTCSGCGNVQEMPLSERTFNCDKCGMSKDRDLNASINILKRALNPQSSNFDSKALKATSGQGGSHASRDMTSAMQETALKSHFVERGTILGVSR